jgi:hypothetical protein
MRRRRRAAGPLSPSRPAPTPPPRSPQLRLWKLTGHGKLRATTRPPLRTFPHPSEILGARPPPAQDYTQLPQPRRRGRKETKRREKMTDSEAVRGHQGGHFDPP